MENRCQQLTDEKNQLIREYQQAIVVLENSERSLSKSSTLQSDSRSLSIRNSSFDEVLKEQIKDNDSLRIALKNKAEECLSLKVINQ